MYSIPAGQIKFQDIEDFCEDEPEEDLILDYKFDWPNDLARILCGMANVQGGMVLVGVGTQPGTRKPAWPPPGVIGTDDSLRQRAIQIAYDNIYPPVLPTIDVVRLQDDPSKAAIVVIRVEASRLLHAIDNRRKVFIRIFDHVRGVDNDLASLAHLEWLFQQRNRSEEFRQFLLDRAGDHAKGISAEFLKQPADAPKAILRLHSVPIFPLQKTSKAPPEVLQIAQGIGTIKSHAAESTLTIPLRCDWRTIADGAIAVPLTAGNAIQSVELGGHGLVYLEQIFPIQPGTHPLIDQPTNLLQAYSVLACCDAFLTFTATYYQRANQHGPNSLVARLDVSPNISLDYRHPRQRHDPLNLGTSGRSSLDNTITLLDEEFSAQGLEGSRHDVLKKITYSLFWAFGHTDTVTEIDGYVANVLGWRAS